MTKRPKSKNVSGRDKKLRLPKKYLPKIPMTDAPTNSEREN